MKKIPRSDVAGKEWRMQKITLQDNKEEKRRDKLETRYYFLCNLNLVKINNAKLKLQ